VTLALTIDVDALPFYRRIHGGDTAARLDDDPIYTIGMPRFFALAAKHGLRPTVFLVGDDAPRFADVLRPGLAATGAEVASHSFAHDYHLSTRSAAVIDADLAAAERALEAAFGARPVGFRAPGYNVSPQLLAVVCARGYRYDSSLLPAPGYWGLRAAAIGAYALLRRPSGSLVGPGRQFAGPLTPYRTGPEAPWTPRAGGPLVELPMAVEPTTRAPFIGTTITTLPRALVDAAARQVARIPLVNLELHAIDLVDASDHPALTELAGAQRDVRVPVAEKLARLDAVLGVLTRTHASTTLAEAAAAVA
jgi:hypothetical protein